MIGTLTDRQRQLLALAILGLVTAILVMITVFPLWIANQHYLSIIDSLDDRLIMLQKAAATGSELQSQHEQLKRLLASNRHYLKSTSEALAAANLQGIINRIAGGKGMEVLSTQILPARVETEFTRVAIKVRIRGTLGNLVKAFHALETSQPYLFLDNITIRTGRQRSSNVSTGQMLDVDFDLIGYMPGQS